MFIIIIILITFIVFSILAIIVVIKTYLEVNAIASSPAFSNSLNYPWASKVNEGAYIFFLVPSCGVRLSALGTSATICSTVPAPGKGKCGTPRLSHFLDNRLTDGCEIFSLTRRPPLPPGRFLVLISVRG
jgi:hypothetical protein